MCAVVPSVTIVGRALRLKLLLRWLSGAGGLVGLGHSSALGGDFKE